MTTGALVTWLLTTACAQIILGLDPRISALLGAVLVVTGPTVVAPLLQHIRPVKRVGSIAKWEGIVIDPIGAVLAVLVFDGVLAHGGEPSYWEMFGLLLRTVVIGGLMGGLSAWSLVQLVKRYWIPDFLHGVVFLASALGVFAVSNVLQEESGLVTVTFMGVVLANQKSISIHHVVEFKEHLGVFLVSCLFIVLGSRLDPSSLMRLGWRGCVFLGLLIFVIRPVAVYLSTIRTRLTLQERTFLAFLAPRGIVAAAVISVFALKVAAEAAEKPHLSGLADQAEQLVPLTFLVIVGTVTVYGLLAGPLAKRLGLSDSDPQGILFGGAEPWIRDVAKMLQSEGVPVLLIDTNYSNIAAAKMAGLPADCTSVLSEHVREELDLSGIGRLLALTPNDEVNALAVREYVHFFGRAHAYQLTPWDEPAGRRSSVAEHLRGRLLFDKELNHDEIVRRINRGAQLKKTRLSDEFGWADFESLYGGTAVILMIFDADKTLKVVTADAPVQPQAGETLLALVDPPQEDA